MLKVVHDAEASNEPAGGSLLDEIVRDGARAMLAAALQAEVAAHVESFVDAVDTDGRRMVGRNGYHAAREVMTAAGAVPVKAPRVNDRRTDPVPGQRRRFAVSILPAWARKSAKVAEVCRCCTCMGCPAATSVRRWNSSSALAPEAVA